MANLNIRVDDEIKKQSEKVFAELGMNTSTAINVFLKQVIRSNGIPFAVSLNPGHENLNSLDKIKE